MRGEGIWKVVAVVVATVLVVGAWGYLLAAWPPDPPRSGVVSAPGSLPGDDASGSPDGSAAEQGPPTAVVLGDSFSVETPGAPGAAWPEVLGQELGWETVTDAAPGSGYLVAGSGIPVTERVEKTLSREPDVVLVAAGVSDLGRPVDEIAAAAEQVVVALRDGLGGDQGAGEEQGGRIVLLSPFSDGPAGELTTALTTRLQEVAAQQGVRYVDVTALLPRGQGLLGPDGVHPSEAGHRHVAEALAEELSDLGVGDAQGVR